jgi:two-component system, chemotaxis family, chemotaxis protein CheY
LIVRTALVVDDSVSMRQMVSFTLSRAGFQVVQAENGQEGLRCLASHKVDLVITDLNMPVMDGIQFIRELRAIPASRWTPVLMLTTESLDAKKQAGKAAGATGWIVKPFNPEKLIQVISKVVP